MADGEQPLPKPAKIQFHYIKSPDYREAACHGVMGGPTPAGKLWLAFFSERGPIPRVVEFTVSPPGEGEAIGVFNEAGAQPSYVDAREGVIRNINFGTYLDVDVARRLHEWLGQQLTKMTEQQ